MAVLPNPIDVPSETRVKLTDGIPYNTVVPGPNSWAQSLEQEKAPPKDTAQTQPTNRDRFEKKPLPKIIPETPQDGVAQPKRYIQPAIPLINTRLPSHKARAVTDPVQINSLLNTRKPSISQLKKKGKIFEFSSSKLDLSDGSNLPHTNVPQKALELLGVQQKSTPIQPAAPSRPHTPISQRFSAKDGNISPSKPACQVQSNPALERLSSNDPKAVNSSSSAGRIFSRQSLREEMCLDGRGIDAAESARIQHLASNDHLGPPKVATFGNIGKQYELVQQPILQPSGSFHGLIETASPAGTEEHDSADYKHIITPTKTVQREPSGEILRPTVYSPSVYNGIWETHPAVGCTIPPFSPVPTAGHPNHEHVPKGLAVGASHGMQDIFKQKFPRDPSAVHGLQPPRLQQNSQEFAFRTVSGYLSPQPHHPQSHNGSGGGPPQPQFKKSTQSRSGSGDNIPQSQTLQGRQSHNAIPPSQRPDPTQRGEHHGLQQAIFDSRTLSVFEHPPRPSANSWAASEDNSPGTSKIPVSALLSPHWPAQYSNNSVPSPPASQQDYQRPSPLSAGLAQLDLTLHHHIDSVFASLSRQITEKHDRVIDRVLLRIDNLEEKVGRGMKDLRAEFSSVKKEVRRLRSTVSDTTHGDDSMMKLLQSFGSKMDALEKQIEATNCKKHIQFVDQSSSEFNEDRHRRYSTHRRTESAHGSLGGSLAHGEQLTPFQLQHQSGVSATSRSSSKARQSGNKNSSLATGFPSRTETGSRQQGSDTKEVVVAESGMGRTGSRTKGNGPDLRDHPAYRQREAYGGNREMLVGPSVEEVGRRESLGEGGWYYQAYGKGI